VVKVVDKWNQYSILNTFKSGAVNEKS
jgi:hypothetical protein